MSLKPCLLPVGGLEKLRESLEIMQLRDGGGIRILVKGSALSALSMGVSQGACQNAGSWAPSLDFQNQHLCGGGGRNPCAGDCSRTSQCCLFVAPPYFQPSTKPSLLLLPPREPFSPSPLGCILALSPRSWAVLGGWLSSAPQIPNGEKTEAGGAGVLLLHSPILSVSQLSPLPGWPPVGAGGPMGEGKAGWVREESMVVSLA